MSSFACSTAAAVIGPYSPSRPPGWKSCLNALLPESTSCASFTRGERSIGDERWRGVENSATSVHRRLEALDELREPVPSVEPAVHRAADALPVSRGREIRDPVVGDVRHQHLRGDLGLQREVRVLLERHAELRAVRLVVGAPGELDVAAAVVAGAVALPQVAEVLPPLVHPCEVRRAAELVDR